MPIDRAAMQRLSTGYERPPVIGALGSHSAIDIADGAAHEGFHTLILAQQDRERTYANYFRAQRDSSGTLIRGCIDETWTFPTFAESVAPAVQERLRQESVLLVPHRALSSYVPLSFIENELEVPILGSRNMLRIEERTERENYYTLLHAGGLPTPEALPGPEAIDGLCIIKLPHAARRLERGFFTAATPEEYRVKSEQLLADKTIQASDLATARIERYVLGPVFNFNFFYSPLVPREDALELLGVDERRESSLDGLVRLPAAQQLEMSARHRIPEYTVVGHGTLTVRESLLEEVYRLGERFVEASRSRYSPGIIGPFCLQTCIDSAGQPTIFDVAVRIGGGTNIHLSLGHPYGNALWREPMSSGRRLAVEVKHALSEDRLGELVT
jgi:5-formaminoimidazole-4-carboxamide-1-(beta)-D-ribofuranosyl 5'-monophosphate synthetase